ncbi:Uncharacterized protein SCF082_LOCUS913, partial [Durusdinium trenchii]
MILTSSWLAQLAQLVAADGLPPETCSWAPLPRDDDFDLSSGFVDSVPRQFARCSLALDAAGGHASGLLETLIFGMPPEHSFSPEASRCPEGLQFEELLLSPRYLVVAAQPEVARSSDWRELIPVGACVPPACHEAFANLALPRLLEWRQGKSAKYHPSPGPCAGAFDVDDASCVQHLDQDIRSEACVTAVHVWRVLCDARFFDELFGAQVRSLPKDSLGESSEFAEHQKAALGHYSTCKEGGGSYVGVYFNAVGEEDPAGAGYALGMCIPSLHTTYSSAVSTIVAWRLGLRMATAYPGVAIDADSVRSAELMHRNELEIGWAIIGLGRSGTTSLAAWLDSHPNLELLSDPEDHFREGSFDYLFRRSHLEHLIRRDELPSAARAGSAGPVRGRRTPLVGIKEPNLLRSSRGRQIMAEMKRTKVLIIFKNWVDWLKSAALFIRPTPCFPRNLARIGEEGNDCSFAFDEAHLFEKVRDLEQKGVARERIKVVHLDTLRAEGPAALRRLGAFLGAGNRSTGSSGSSAGAMPQEGEVAEDEVEFWEELCGLPTELARRLERRRSEALRGCDELLRRSGEPIPESVLRPVPIQQEACQRMKSKIK